MNRLLVEHPRFSSQKVALYARSNGSYDRPVVGMIVDLRFEDMGDLAKIAQSSRIPNIIARLPDITEADQNNAFLIFNFGWLDRIETDEANVQELLATGKYLLLPDGPQSEYWEYTNSPWWEFAEILDEYDGIIKAAKISRPGEATPEEIDEKLDEFDENRYKLEVLSPTTLSKMLTGAVVESYLKKLSRI